MKKILHISLLGLIAAFLPLVASAQAANTSASSFSISAPNANGQSTFSQTSSLTVPSATDPNATQTYQFKSDGIYGCNQTGAAASSVGSFSAGGVYVPVADATVELNTGYLVYLFCSLRPLVSALSENATAGIVAKIETAITTGNNGNPRFSVNADAEDLQVATNRFTQVMNAGILNPLNPALQAQTQSALAQTFAGNTQQPNSVLKCPYTGDLNALLSGQFSWSGLQALENPACTPMGAYQLASNVVNGYIAGAVQNNANQRLLGNGMYPITTTDSFGNVNVVTPGSMVLAQANQALGAGLLKTINAQDIGQMVNALFAGIGATAVTTPQGLTGITQPLNSPSSYISQMVAAASANASANIVGTAVTDLNTLISAANRIYNALFASVALYATHAQQLRGNEISCWNDLIGAICDPNSLQYTSSGPTCTKTTPASTVTTPGTSGGRSGSGTSGTTVTTPASTITLHIATSTEFSDAAIATFAQAANAASTSLGYAQADINTISTLGASLQSTSQDVQSLAIVTLEQDFVANHSTDPTDQTPTIAAAQAQETTLKNLGPTLDTLVTNTTNQWEGNTGATDPTTGQTVYQPWDQTVSANTVGWCDYTNQTTLADWLAIWSK